MYFEKDAKIVIAIRSIMGIAGLLVLTLLIIFWSRGNPHADLTILYLLVGSIVSVLGVLATASLMSLRRENRRQAEYHTTHPKPTVVKTVNLPYDKSGLYAIMFVSIFLICFSAYFYASIPKTTGKGPASTPQFLAAAFSVIILVLLLALILSVYFLHKRTKNPIYATVLACPCCGSVDVHMVDYSWWGGFFANDVHEVRCKSCGKAYNGMTGSDILPMRRRGYD